MDTPNAVSPRPHRPVLAAIGGLLAAAGALFLPAIVSAVRGSSPDMSPEMDLFSDVLAVTLFGVAPLAFGLWLLYLGAPSLPGRMRAGAAALASARSWSAIVGRLAASSLGRALLMLVGVAIAALLMPAGTRGLPVFLALMIYSIKEPMQNAYRPRWWASTIKSVAGWFLLFMAAGAISEVDKMGDGTMIFLAPFMVFPALIALSALIRLVRWYRSRDATASLG